MSYVFKVEQNGPFLIESLDLICAEELIKVIYFKVEYLTFSNILQLMVIQSY